MVILVCVGSYKDNGSTKFKTIYQNARVQIVSEDMLTRERYVLPRTINMRRVKDKNKCSYKYIKELDTDDTVYETLDTYESLDNHDNQVCAISTMLYKGIITSGMSHEFKTNQNLKAIELRGKAIGLSSNMEKIGDDIILVLSNTKITVYTSKQSFKMRYRNECAATSDIWKRFTSLIDKWKYVGTRSNYDCYDVDKPFSFSDNNDSIGCTTDCSYLYNLCTSAKKLIFSETYFSYAVTLYKCFEQFEGVEVDLSKCDFRNAAYFTEMFRWSTIGKLNLSNKTTRNVVDMGHMFSASKFETINLSEFNTSNCRSMFAMFESCEAKSIIGIENFNTCKVLDMASMFLNFVYDKLDLSKYDVSHVKSMDGMFYNAKIDVLDIHGWNLSADTVFKNMFTDCVIDTLIISKSQSEIINKILQQSTESDIFNIEYVE